MEHSLRSLTLDNLFRYCSQKPDDLGYTVFRNNCTNDSRVSAIEAQNLE